MVLLWHPLCSQNLDSGDLIWLSFDSFGLVVQMNSLVTGGAVGVAFLLLFVGIEGGSTPFMTPCNIIALWECESDYSLANSSALTHHFAVVCRPLTVVLIKDEMSDHVGMPQKTRRRKTAWDLTARAILWCFSSFESFFNRMISTRPARSVKL